MFIKDKIKIFVLSVSIIYLIGGSYLYAQGLGKKIDIPIGPALTGVIMLSSSKVEVTKDTTNKNKIHTVILTARLTNNTSYTLTGVKLVIPIDVGTLEMPNTKRITNLPGQGADSIFGLPNLLPKTTMESKILLYSKEKRVYQFKPQIDTNERYTTTANLVSLTSE